MFAIKLSERYQPADSTANPPFRRELKGALADYSEGIRPPHRPWLNASGLNASAYSDRPGGSSNDSCSPSGDFAAGAGG
jgi:hypothetical protein